MLRNIYCPQLDQWFSSIDEAASIGKIGPSLLASRLSKFGIYKSAAGLDFILKKPETHTFARKNPRWYKRAVPVRCVETNTYYVSIKQLQDELGISNGYISKCLKEKGRYIDKKTGYTYVYAYESNVPTSLLTPKQDNSEYVRTGFIICKERGLRFESLQVFSKHVNEELDKVAYKMNRDGRYIGTDGLTYMYETKKVEKSTSTTDIDEIICEQTGDRFESVEALSKFLDREVSSIENGFNNWGKFPCEGRTYIRVKDLKQDQVKKIEKVSKIDTPVVTSEVSTEQITDMVKEEVKEVTKKITRRKHSRKGLAVVCEQTGEHFDSIHAVEIRLGIRGGWIGVKLKAEGRYTDKNGMTYVYEKDYVPTAKPEVVEEEKPVIQVAVEQKEAQSKTLNEQLVLNDALISFITKFDYVRARILCETMSKLYTKE